MLLLAFSCVAPPPDTGAAPVHDLDADGYTQAEDCDDADPDAYPGARDDDCDGVDDDCDGRADEDNGDARVWYADADGDGYGDFASPRGGCVAPGGYVEDAFDCDDADAAVHPFARDDTCDGVDHDCDGYLDEDSPEAVPFHPDADGDGYGDTRSTVLACVAPEGHLADDRDCDDSDATVNPQGTEQCNGGDDDCDGLADPGCGEGFVAEVDLAGWADRWIEAEAAGDEIQFDFAVGGDADGNGTADTIVGAQEADGDAVDSGTAYLLLDAVASPTLLADAGASVRGGTEDGDFGGAVAWVGDLDLDGLDDWAVGASNEQDAAGAIYVVPGSGRGAIALDTLGAFVGESDGDYAGTALLGLADLDGAGTPAFLAGAIGTGRTKGTVYAFTAAPSGTQAVTDAVASLEGENAEDRAGRALADAGDVDGDGLGDVIVGAPGDDSTRHPEGIAYLVLGPIAGATSLGDAYASISGVADGDLAGRAVAGPGDLDGDGLADVMVGSPDHDAGGTNAGAAYVLTAPAAGASSLRDAPARILGEDCGGYAGFALAGLGDADGDGRMDAVVGAPFCEVELDEEGTAYVLTSVPSGTVVLGDVASARMRGGLEGWNAGRAFAVSGSDLYVGADGPTGLDASDGRIYVVDLAAWF